MPKKCSQIFLLCERLANWKWHFLLLTWKLVPGIELFFGGGGMAPNLFADAATGCYINPLNAHTY